MISPSKSITNISKSSIKPSFIPMSRHESLSNPSRPYEIRQPYEAPAIASTCLRHPPSLMAKLTCGVVSPLTCTSSGLSATVSFLPDCTHSSLSASALPILGNLQATSPDHHTYVHASH